MTTEKTMEAPASDVESEAIEAEEAPRVSLESLLDEPRVAEDASAAALDAAVGMRTARVTNVTGRTATILFRGRAAPMSAQIAPEVDPDVVSDACANGDSVLIEVARDAEPLVVGVLQTRRPREIRLRAATVHIEGEEEVLLRSGRGALRIREDGDIEVVGSRISAASRGLFRIVGRLLRLN